MARKFDVLDALTAAMAELGTPEAIQIIVKAVGNVYAAVVGLAMKVASVSILAGYGYNADGTDKRPNHEENDLHGQGRQTKNKVQKQEDGSGKVKTGSGSKRRDGSETEGDRQ